jgi:hypothetical protein
MNFKSAAAILSFFCGSLSTTFGQSTAYANVFAEVVAPVGIENSPGIEKDHLTDLLKKNTVIFLEVNVTEDPDKINAEVPDEVQTTIKISGDPLTTIHLSLSETIEGESNEIVSLPVESTFTSISISAQPVQNAHALVRLGDGSHNQEGPLQGEHPVIITLNCN